MNITIRQVRGGSGIDVWADILCRGIRNQGHNCSVDLRPEIFQFIPSLAKFQRNLPDSDIIHGNSWNAFAFKNDLPLVVTEHHVVHDPAYDPYRSFAQKAFHRWIYRCEKRSFEEADLVTCVSRYTQKKLEETFGVLDSHVIYNGIDTAVFRPVEQFHTAWNVPRDKTVLFFAGNLSRRKGGDLLPAIMKELGDDYVLLLATGQKESSFGFMKNIINVGRLDLPDLIKAYNQCDIFLTASRLEGFGLSVAEAMACGKPVVATNGSSLPELVVNGKGGFLCRMDDVNDFAGKIRYLASDEEVRREMGMFNRNLIEEKFTLERMVGEYLDIYQRVIE